MTGSEAKWGIGKNAMETVGEVGGDGKWDGSG